MFCTSLFTAPNPIDATSINIEIENPEIENANCSYVRLRVIWKVATYIINEYVCIHVCTFVHY